MDKKLEQAIQSFMDNVEGVNEIHHPNDYNRLYNIALYASLIGKGFPSDKMKEAFNKALNERKLNKERFEKAYPEYEETARIAFDVINRMREKDIQIPASFRF